MSTLPKVLKNYVAYMDGVGYAGKVPEAKLPTIAIKTEDYDAGGLAAPVPIDTGTMAKMDAEVTFAEYTSAVLGLFGNPNASLTLRGAQEADLNSAEPVIVTMRGLFEKIDPGSWKKGSQTAAKCTVSLKYLKITVGGTTVIEIDALNMKRIVNGVDQLSSIRTALGM
ncbi:MAG TPA: phage major tail tube protein [Azospirillum sp.]|nr:phage major tail tube protein [Azospirillum sp.]